MKTRTIVHTGARGGHGTTTVAAALALFAARHQPTVLVSSGPSTAAFLGLPPSDGHVAPVSQNLVLVADPAEAIETGPQIVVIDAQTAVGDDETDAQAERYVVLRGPCYVALASLVASAARPDGIILVAEPKRSLTARDVTDVLDVPVVVTVDMSPDVPRTIDAGLLVARVHRLRELAPLRALATDPYAGRLRPSTARSRQRRTPLLKIDTDLPFAQSANSGGFRRARQRAHSGPVEVTVTTSRRSAPVRKTGVAAVGAGAEPLVGALAGDAQRVADIGPRGTIAFSRPRDFDARDPVCDLGELEGHRSALESVRVRSRELSDQATRFADDTLIGYSTARHDRQANVRTTPLSGPH